MIALLKRMPLVVVAGFGPLVGGWHLAPIFVAVAVLAAGYERFLAHRKVDALRDELADMEAADRFRRIMHGHTVVEPVAEPQPEPVRVLAFAGRGALAAATPHIGRPPVIDVAAYRDGPDVTEPAQWGPPPNEPKLGLRARLGLLVLRYAPLWTLAVLARQPKARHAAGDETDREAGDDYTGGRHAAEPNDRPMPAEQTRQLRTLADGWRISTGEWDAAYRRFFADETIGAGAR